MHSVQSVSIGCTPVRFLVSEKGCEIKAIDESINASPATAPSRFVSARHMLAINRESGRKRREREKKRRDDAGPR